MILAGPGVAAPVIDILDVGHGSCVVIRSGDDVILIDAGPGGAILEYLRTERIVRIKSILVSHADADHIGGISAILGQEEFRVDSIICNGDSLKQSSLWKNLAYQLADLHEKGHTTIQLDVRSGMNIEVGQDGNVEVRVLAPGSVLGFLGAGSSLRDGSAISSNTMSVVAQVLVGGVSTLLIPGDLDWAGYALLSESAYGPEVGSKYMILPHHGGLMGTPDQTVQAIAAFVSAVNPEVVFVSNGRGKFNNPRQDVVAAVRLAGAQLPVVCTQLSKLCAARELGQESFGGPYSAGWVRGYSCRGTTRLTVGNGLGVLPDLSRHYAFVAGVVPNPICIPSSRAT